MRAFIILLGRMLMSAIFLRGGYGKLMAPTATMGMLMQVAYGLAVAVELLGGALILVGWKTRLVAPIMAVWCIATAFVAHWHPDDTAQMINFMKNLGMAGGFLQLAAFGPGLLSIDRLTARGGGRPRVAPRA